MWLQAERVPNPMHAHRTDAGGFREHAGAPVRRAVRAPFQRPSHDFLDLGVVNLPRGARPRFIEQAVNAACR